MSPTSYQAAPSRVSGANSTVCSVCVKRYFLIYRDFLKNRFFMGKEKGHCVNSSLFSKLVAGAGFEPTTFGL